MPEPPTLARWTLVLPNIDIPRPDRLQGSRRNRAYPNTAYGYRRVRLQWESMLRDWVRRDGIPRPLERRRLLIVRQRRSVRWSRRAADLQSGIRPIIEAFVHSQLVIDDSSRWLHLEMQQVRSSDGDRLLVVLEQL